VTPKTLAKEPAPTLANKLTKLITPSSAKSISDKPNHSENGKELVRDHSKDVVPEKKYMEHCFSDEYPTTTDDEDEEDENSGVKAPTKKFLQKKPANESDDETSDVSESLLYLFFIATTFFSLSSPNHSAKSKQIPNRGLGAESLSGRAGRFAYRDEISEGFSALGVVSSIDDRGRPPTAPTRVRALHR
jgi:hypothetical protein